MNVQALIEKYGIEESDYPVPSGTSLWIKFHGFDVHLIRTDEGIVVDVWKGHQISEPVATTYAFDSDGDEEEEDA